MGKTPLFLPPSRQLCPRHFSPTWAIMPFSSEKWLEKWLTFDGQGWPRALEEKKQYLGNWSMMWFQVKHVSLRISLCYHRTMQPHFRLHHPHPKPEAAHATHKSENQVLAENGGCLANFSGENDGYSNSYRLIDHGNLMVTDVKGW